MNKFGLRLTILLLVLVLVISGTGCNQANEEPTPTPSPMPTSTLTSTSTPSPTQTTPSSPIVLFSDDFSDPLSGWDTYSDSRGSVAYSNGWLHLMNYTDSAGSMVSYNPHTFTDFILEVETKLVDGTDHNWHSVGCRDDGYNNYYNFGISSDGYYCILKWVNGAKIVLKETTYSADIHTVNDATNIMRIECIGSTLELSVNDILLASVTDSAYNDGYISLECSALLEDLSEIAFDNLVVYAPLM